jgi:hypothetical protein
VSAAEAHTTAAVNTLNACTCITAHGETVVKSRWC